MDSPPWAEPDNERGHPALINWSKIDVHDSQGDGFASDMEHLVGRTPCIEKILQQVYLLPHARDAEKLEQTTVSQCSYHTQIM